MKNTLTDVKNHLIAEMERLNDEEFVSDKEILEKEIKKANALSSLAEQIVNLQQVEVNAMKTAKECGLLYKSDTMEFKELPPEFEKKNKNRIKIGEFGRYED